MVRLDRRKKEEYVKKRMRKLSDVININDQPRYWKSLFSLVGKKKKNKKLWFSRETAEKRGRRVIRRTSSIGIGRGRVSTFSSSLRFARGNVTRVSCYFPNRR